MDEIGLTARNNISRSYTMTDAQTAPPIQPAKRTSPLIRVREARERFVRAFGILFGLGDRAGFDQIFAIMENRKLGLTIDKWRGLVFRSDGLDEATIRTWELDIGLFADQRLEMAMRHKLSPDLKTRIFRKPEFVIADWEAEKRSDGKGTTLDPSIDTGVVVDTVPDPDPPPEEEKRELQPISQEELPAHRLRFFELACKILKYPGDLTTRKKRFGVEILNISAMKKVEAFLAGTRDCRIETLSRLRESDLVTRAKKQGKYHELDLTVVLSSKNRSKCLRKGSGDEDGEASSVDEIVDSNDDPVDEGRTDRSQVESSSKPDQADQTSSDDGNVTDNTVMAIDGYAAPEDPTPAKHNGAARKRSAASTRRIGDTSIVNGEEASPKGGILRVYLDMGDGKSIPLGDVKNVASISEFRVRNPAGPFVVVEINLIANT